MPERVRITIASREPQVLRDLIRSQELDVSCGGARQSPSGEWTLEAYVAPEVEARLRRDGYRMETDAGAGSRADTRRLEVGKGDRFAGGKIPPRGVGRKE